MGPSTLVSQPQREMPMLAQMERPGYVREDIISKCDTLLDAIHICIQLARLPHKAIAKRLGIDPGHWTRMMQGQAHFPTNKMASLMQLCGNYAPLQWLAKATGQEIAVDQRELRRQQLRRELEELDAQAA